MYDYEITEIKVKSKVKKPHCRFKVGDTIINIKRLQEEKKPQNWTVVEIKKSCIIVRGLVENRWYQTQRETDINQDAYKFYKTLDEYNEMFPEYFV